VTRRALLQMENVNGVLFAAGISASIYIYKEECLSVCLSVLYAFSPCNSYDHQTFHDASLGPKEGRRGVGMVIGVCGGGWVRFHPSHGI
jgi:hypothetical protein